LFLGFFCVFGVVVGVFGVFFFFFFLFFFVGFAFFWFFFFFSPAVGVVAPALYRALKRSTAAIAKGERLADVLLQGKTAIEQAGFVVDYFEARNAETLAPVRSLADGPIRMLVAAKLGNTRLIDNMAVQKSRK
jgi:hypothetical protein